MLEENRKYRKRNIKIKMDKTEYKLHDTFTKHTLLFSYQTNVSLHINILELKVIAGKKKKK